VRKGTQADLLQQRLGACHLSTGDVFRAAACRKACQQTPAMTQAQSLKQLMEDENSRWMPCEL
jgi:adenylate kinase family enzyme